MSHALLLRLFLSPSFFSVHVALQYLMLYADNIGITYYLTRRLKELDTQELREVWGFIWYLPVLIEQENYTNSLAQSFARHTAFQITGTGMLCSRHLTTVHTYSHDCT
jgi:hypothetical protein